MGFFQKVLQLRSHWYLIVPTWSTIIAQEIYWWAYLERWQLADLLIKLFIGAIHTFKTCFIGISGDDKSINRALFIIRRQGTVLQNDYLIL